MKAKALPTSPDLSSFTDFNKYLLNALYVPGTVPDTGGHSSEQANHFPALMEIIV